MTSRKQPIIYVSGHRNPDIDSLASAYALAELRNRQKLGDVHALCPGIFPERAAYLFKRFHCPMPECRNDIYLKIGDIMDKNPPVIMAGTSLLDAVARLNENGPARMAVINQEKQFLGMLSPLTLLSELLNISDNTSGSFTSRKIKSTLPLIMTVIKAEALTECFTTELRPFEVYVAAMGLDSFNSHIPEANENLIIIVGDRPEIHLRALQRGIKIMIITGDRPMDPLILKEAAEQKVTILRTAFDSATVIRRLKFSVPVEFSKFSDLLLHLTPHEKVRDWRYKIINNPEDVIPVTDKDNIFRGTILKRYITSDPPPFKMILVDHNEIEQSLPGVADLPVIEVVDHHRIAMPPTATPIKYTADAVGSTCTLVASMFRTAGESINPDTAGLLLGGIIADTLNLKSPTAVSFDLTMYKWLEKLSGVKGDDLMAELMKIDSPLATSPAMEVLNSDRKNYTDHGLNFALSQVEETNLELLHQRNDEIRKTMLQQMEEKKLDFFALLATDAVRGNSQMIIEGDKNFISQLPYAKTESDIFNLPGVVSRKKQLLPQVLAICSAITAS